MGLISRVSSRTYRRRINCINMLAGRSLALTLSRRTLNSTKTGGLREFGPNLGPWCWRSNPIYKRYHKFVFEGRPMYWSRRFMLMAALPANILFWYVVALQEDQINSALGSNITWGCFSMAGMQLGWVFLGHSIMMLT